MEDRMQIKITRVYYKRIVLYIEGKVEGMEKPQGLQARFVEEGSRRVLLPQHLDFQGKRFILSMNVLSVNQEAPMESGLYYLEFSDGSGSPLRVKGPETEEARQALVGGQEASLFIGTAKTNRFWAVSKFDLDTDEFYLDVEYAAPAGEITWRVSLRKKIAKFQRWMSRKKKRLFVRYFNFFSKHVKRTGNKIFFCSASRSRIGGNEQFIRDRMLERGLDKKFVFRYDFVASINERRSLRAFMRFGYYLATSDIIVLDDYYPQVYLPDYPPDVKVIQAWHACGAFKTVGLERMGKPGAPELNTRIHKCYTHIPVSSELSVRHNAEAFGLDESKFYPVGVPRTDIFFDPDYIRRTKKKMYEAFPQAKKAKTVYLYAPTFRGINARDAYFPFQKVDFVKWGQFCKETDACLLVKMHPFVRESVEIPPEYADYIIDAASYREVNDILFIVDVLITDYSSIIYEFSLLRRPMYFYAFDQKMYEATRDFYEPYEKTIPGQPIKSFDELMDTLREGKFDYQWLDSFVRKNFTYTDGKATDRVIDQIILGKK